MLNTSAVEEYGDDDEYIVLEAPPSMWALNDDQIEAYVADDDGPSELGGVPAWGVVLLVVVLSGCICLAIFFCSYRQERTGSCCCCCKRRDTDNDEECDPTLKRSILDIESGLMLKLWEGKTEHFQDELTQNSCTSDDEEDCFLNTTFIDTSAIAAAPGEPFHDLADPAFLLLRQKPRCILCSKVFKEKDIVSTSHDPSCFHHYHKECIIKWLQERNGCPVCKRPYIGEDKAESTAEESAVETGNEAAENLTCTVNGAEMAGESFENTTNKTCIVSTGISSDAPATSTCPAETPNEDASNTVLASNDVLDNTTNLAADDVVTGVTTDVATTQIVVEELADETNQYADEREDSAKKVEQVDLQRIGETKGGVDETPGEKEADNLVDDETKDVDKFEVIDLT